MKNSGGVFLVSRTIQHIKLAKISDLILLESDYGSHSEGNGISNLFIFFLSGL